jgi:hypothetical protein
MSFATFLRAVRPEAMAAKTAMGRWLVTVTLMSMNV